MTTEQVKWRGEWSELTFTMADLLIDEECDANVPSARRIDFRYEARQAYPSDENLSGVFYYGALIGYEYGDHGGAPYTMNQMQDDAFYRGRHIGSYASTLDMNDDDLEPIHADEEE
jgi:hypothetical protein